MRQLLAAFIFFTRLPFWRLANVPADCFKRILPYWPLTGWLTAVCSVLVLYTASFVLPVNVSLLLAMITRLLMTGCLHEDGLADFIDGFGGGTSRERILSIMKDSHIGTYGVIGLIFYFAFYYSILVNLSIGLMIAAILAGDPLTKGISAMIVNRLPYVRTEQASKSGVVYNKMNVKEYIICVLAAAFPLISLPHIVYMLAALLPIVCWYFLTSLMKRKIYGYTGDCCGAMFLLCELCFYLGILLIYTIY